MKRKSIVLTTKDLKIDIPKKKTISDDLMERYLRRTHQRISNTDKQVVKYLQEKKGATCHQTSSDLSINYKTSVDVFRRLEMAGIVKFILKVLPTRDGRKKVSTKYWTLTSKFIKVVV